VRTTYSWHKVAERTEKCYYAVMEQPLLNTLGKIMNFLAQGTITGVFCVAFYVLDIVFTYIFDWM